MFDTASFFRIVVPTVCIASVLLNFVFFVRTNQEPAEIKEVLIKHDVIQNCSAFYAIHNTTIPDKEPVIPINSTIIRPPDEQEILRAMSYNLRYRNPGDDRQEQTSWNFRRALITSMILWHKADILGTQEGLIDMLTYLNSSLGADFNWTGTARDDGIDKGEHAAIFYKKSRFDLLFTGRFWLSETPDEPGSVGWDAGLTRVAHWGMFRSVHNSEKHLLFMTTHLDQNGKQARKNGAALIVRKIDDILQDAKINKSLHNISVILTGDFNDDPDSIPITTASTPYFRIPNDNATQREPDVWLRDSTLISHMPHHGPNTTHRGWTNKLRRWIDYIFVQDLEILQHATLSDVWEEDVRPSDHRPVSCDFTWPR